MSGRSVAALVILLILPGSVEAQQPQLLLNSQLGDFIGQGRQRSLTSADGTFTIRRNFDNGVSIFFLGTQPGSFWNLDFAAAGDAELVKGVYEAATRFPFQLSSAAGLSVAGDGAGCNTLTGRFEVLEVTFGPGDEVRSFAADFEQHCEGVLPALFGSFRFEPGAPLAPTGLHVAGRSIIGARLAWSQAPARAVTP